ncbi:uncharacterized protein LOC129608099 [Condylostylus longicornis]|uniref:uncharacterized protein LOC129608099 n=1 Tax=Condylostylus longicornis TaxID=2530218 RepID=UPI00244DCDA6|nr:uncharacterized protein LOC129608099 [Condylostylus longicornis]
MCDGSNETCLKPALSADNSKYCNIRPCCSRQDPCRCVQSCCYKQPPRVQSFKPISNYSRPTEKMECCTIYNRSYFPIRDDICRAKPIYPSNNLCSSSGLHDMNTIQKMSYQTYSNIPRAQPILPAPNSLSIREGPQFMITTQKHDYVAKSVPKAQPILPCHNINRTCAAPLEKLTINKLSFMPIDINKFPRPKPIIPISNCKRPAGPIENMTIQKLSYMPVSIPQKQDLPWKNPPRIVPPSYPYNQGTTYSLSYMPNCNIKKPQPCLPNECAQLFGTEIPKPCTVYNLSFMNNKSTRTQAIKPVSNLVTPQGPFESCTVYKLSYLPNGSKRTLPILPINNQIKSNELMSKITTQKHDFTAKPYSKPSPIIKSQNIPRLAGKTEQYTINRLSYMPFDVSKFHRPKPLKPVENPKCLPPLSMLTTYKLSYMPQQITTKETFPWQEKPKYNKPTLPLECLTIQKLSYLPPGSFNGNCSCSCELKNATPNFARAEIC